MKILLVSLHFSSNQVFWGNELDLFLVLFLLQLVVSKDDFRREMNWSAHSAAGAVSSLADKADRPFKNSCLEKSSAILSSGTQVH